MSNEKTIKQRLKKIRTELKQGRLDGLIVTSAANVTYTTGFRGDDSWALITPGNIYLLTDSRYIEQAQTECHCCKIIQRHKTLAEATAKITAGTKSIKTIGLEDSTSLAAFKALKKHLKVGLRQTTNIVESIRVCKDSTETKAIQQAANIAGMALRKTLRYIKPGVSENKLAGLLDLQIRKLGSQSSFETIVAFGPNASRVHHKPTNRKLKKSDTILIDFGARYDGYCCDLTRCFMVGKVTRFYARVYKAVQQAQQAAVSKVKAGAEIAKVDAAARDVLASHHLPLYGHGTGHGIGLQAHELPTIAKKAKGKLQAGQVITIEPAVYIPAKLGIRIEDDCLVTRTACKILTRDCPHQPLLLT